MVTYDLVLDPVRADKHQKRVASEKGSRDSDGSTSESDDVDAGSPSSVSVRSRGSTSTSMTSGEIPFCSTPQDQGPLGQFYNQLYRGRELEHQFGDYVGITGHKSSPVTRFLKVGHLVDSKQIESNKYCNIIYDTMFKSFKHVGLSKMSRLSNAPKVFCCILYCM